MPKPASLQYGADDVPPLPTTMGAAFQHLAISAASLSVPVIVLDAAGASVAQASAVLTIGLIVLGLGTILQCQGLRIPPFGMIGSRFFVPIVFTSTYLPALLPAAQAGGLGLAFGMLMFAGLVEVIVARVLRRFPQLFPSELSGLLIVIIGVQLGIVGIQLGFRLDNGHAQLPVPLSEHLMVVGATLTVTIALAVWSRPPLRSFAALIGMAAGVLAFVLNGLSFPQVPEAADITADFAFPVAIPAFAWEFVLPFAACGIAAALQAVGGIIIAQRVNDADWTRPDTHAIQRGVAADGLTTMLAGLLGTVGINTNSGSVGLTAATGNASRRVGLALGCLYIACAIIPGLPELLMRMPRPVMGGALLFVACYILSSGIQIIGQQVMDARSVLIVALPAFLGLSRHTFPELHAALPQGLQLATQSALGVAVISALVLNAIFRLGVRQVIRKRLIAAPLDAPTMLGMLEDAAERWGLRTETYRSARNAMIELGDLIPALARAGEPVEIAMTHDQYFLMLTVEYAGPPLGRGSGIPTPDELIEDPAGAERLALALLDRYADRIVRQKQPDGRQRLRLQFRL